MPSKPLSLTTAKSMQLTADQRDIEVPKGSHRFVIKQQAGEQQHTFHLRHQGTEVAIIGLVEASDANPSLETLVIHHAPHTRAETIVKTLVRNNAEPRYRGMIRIEEGSNGCESYLQHHSLLLGKQAQSWTTPSLEILNNDVHCSHAATVRTITALDLFYLQSRGLSSQEAETLLIEAFLSDVQS